MPSISKSTSTRRCLTVTPHSLTRPLTFLSPMVTRMPRTDSRVRAPIFRFGVPPLGGPVPVPPKGGTPNAFFCHTPSMAALGVALLILPACKPKEIQILLGPSQALSTVLAEEAARLAGPKKQIALITADASWGPPSAHEET